MVPQYAGYSVYADLKIGANGNDEGVSELTAADSSGAAAFGHTTWDADVSDGVDSGWVQVQLVAGPSGVTWTVGNRPPVQVADSVGGEVLSLKVRAAVSGANRQSSWRDLVASFYGSADADLSQPQEQMMLSRSRTPVASTMNAADPTAEADQVTDIIPEGSGYTKMMLTASVRIESLSGILPSPDSMFGQVYLYTSPPPVASPTETTAVYVAVAPVTTTTTADTSVVEITNFTDALSPDELALLS